jgi:predicted FMN-binding regulatory protein PaiB
MPNFEHAPQERTPADSEVIAAFSDVVEPEAAQRLFRKWEIGKLECAEKAATLGEMFRIEIEIAQMYGRTGMVQDAREQLERVLRGLEEQEALATPNSETESELHEVRVEAVRALGQLPKVQ